MASRETTDGGAARAFQDQFRIENRCYGCGPDNPEGLHIKSYWDGDDGVCVYQPRPSFMAGPPQILNGGVIAILVDCHSICTAVATLFKEEGRPIGSDPLIWCVTASMDIYYLRPTPIDVPVKLRARVLSREVKRFVVACTLHSSETETVHGRVVAVRVPLSWRGVTADHAG